jgi:hypothetical protein
MVVKGHLQKNMAIKAIMVNYLCNIAQKVILDFFGGGGGTSKLGFVYEYHLWKRICTSTVYRVEG